MSLLPYFVAGWLLLVGCFGVVRSRDLIHTVVCVAVAQSGTYVLLLSIGFQYGASAPVQGAPGPVVDSTRCAVYEGSSATRNAGRQSESRHATKSVGR